jgi:cytochrome c551/c552
MSDIKVALPTVLTNKDISDGYSAQITSDNALKVDGSSFTQPISGTVTAEVAEVTSGLICVSSAVTSLGNGLTDTAAYYAVSAGETFYLKSAVATGSAGPCKVVVDYTDSSNTVVDTLCTAFFSSTNPTVQIVFPATIDIPATNIVRVRVTNNCGRSQNVYGTIMGRSV